MEISAKDISENEKNSGVLVRYWDFNEPIPLYGNFLQNNVMGWFFYRFFFVACPEESRVTPQKRSAVWIDQCVHQKYYAPGEKKLGDALEDGGNGS